MEDYSYLSKEQLRYIRRTSRSKLSLPSDIIPMIDLITRIYQKDKNSNFGYNSWKKYEHDINHILFNWPYLEVHLHVALQDSKFMKNVYAGLENSGPDSRYEQTAHNKKVYQYYLKVCDFIPTVKDAMIICG